MLNCLLNFVKFNFNDFNNISLLLSVLSQLRLQQHLRNFHTVAFCSPDEFDS